MHSCTLLTISACYSYNLHKYKVWSFKFWMQSAVSHIWCTYLIKKYAALQYLLLIVCGPNCRNRAAKNNFCDSYRWSFCLCMSVLNFTQKLNTDLKFKFQCVLTQQYFLWNLGMRFCLSTFRAFIANCRKALRIKTDRFRFVLLLK